MSQISIKYLRQNRKSRLPTAPFIKDKGFTLVELVMVMVLTGVIAGIAVDILVHPVDTYTHQARRAELVDIADAALDRMSRDLRDALPNSVRIGCGGACIEFLHSFAGGRYRATLSTAGASDVLSFNPADNDTSFDWLGPDTGTANVVAAASGNTCKDVGATCLVVYNTGTGNGDAYSGANVAAVTSAAAGTPNSIGFSFGTDAGFGLTQTAFPGASPDQRFYLVDTPISYICDTGQNTLRRYQGYSIEANHAATDSHAELTGTLSNNAEHSLLANQIEGCSFTYTAGTSSRNALVTIRLQVSQDGDSVVLHQQVQVSNTP